MHRVITIGREFGSGGRELGRRLSEHLGYAYYDQEIVIEIAKRTKLSEEYVRWVSESRPVTSFPIHVGRSFYVMPDPTLEPSLEVFSQQHALLKELSEKSDCIIVGRCADFVLRDKSPFRIFVYADEESKIKRCMQRQPADEPLTEREMKKRIASMDRNRAQYYSYFSDQKWGVRENYDLMLNTSGKDIKSLSRALASFLTTMKESSTVR